MAWDEIKEETWFQVKSSNGGFYSTYKTLSEAVNLSMKLMDMGEEPVIKIIVKQEGGEKL